MNKQYGFLVCCITVLMLTACRKAPAPGLPAASVSIQGYTTTTDTLVKEMPVLVDSIITFKLAAMLNGQPATGDHHIRFGVDTAKMALYRNKYGHAQVLPYTSYFFVKSDCHIREGNTLSDTVALNIVQESLLRPYTTYVLPLVIQSVDWQKDAVATGEVMYLVFKAGKALFISKAGWTVIGASHGVGSNAIDDNLNTRWASGLRDSPPYWIEIDFGYAVTFSGVTAVPNSLSNSYPTRVQIELSEEGSTWTDKGTFDLEPAELQVINTGISTARYMRFTVLDVGAFSGFTPISIKEISLEP